MARRVGSASAPKVALSWSGEGLALVGFGTIWFNISPKAPTSRLIYHVVPPRRGAAPQLAAVAVMNVIP
jgi:hypothetical protein